MRRHYQHLDVFADSAFSGNQLAVFTSADGLTDRHMQLIAAEMAFSETTFVLRPESPDVIARLRIFTPTRELPMAGHPTIGTTFALAAIGKIQPGAPSVTLSLGVGLTDVMLEWDGSELSFAWMRQPAPRFGAVMLEYERLAAAIGVHTDEIGPGGLPAQQVSSGVPFLFVPLTTRDAVNRARPDRAALQAFFAADGETELPLFVFSLERERDATVFSRMFAPVFGIQEDPATGGASGPLGAYLVHHGVVRGSEAAHMISLQGVAMGRPSRIAISVVGESGEIADVRVGGKCVRLGEGFLDVPEDPGES